MLNLTWQAFLLHQGAQIEAGQMVYFDAASNEHLITQDDTVLCALSQFGILKFSGEDASSFLQNLCSNNIKAVTHNQAQLSSLNTAKGRVLATFLIWQTGVDYFLQLPCSLIASIQKKLSMYVLRSKVKIEDISTQLVCFGIAGKKASTLLQASIDGVSSTLFSVAQQPGLSIICVANPNKERFQIYTTPEHAITLWQQLSTHARPMSSSYWDWLNICAGIPVVLAATQEQFVLQMLNFDILGGVSFKKGCYPGQEIVARMHYLGKLKQRTYLAHIASDIAPQANDPLFSDDFLDQISGNILNAAPAPHGGYDVLATLHSSSFNNALSVHWNSPAGVVLNFLTQPYTLPAGNAA